MSLHRLPAELLSLILQMLDSPRDLLSLITASAPCLAAYSNAPSLFLTSLLRNAIHPAAMHHALAALHVPTVEPHHPKALAPFIFIRQYFEPSSFTFPTDMPGLKSLCRLYSRISFFIQDYASYAMRTMLNQPSTMQQTLQLSGAERARFQRAFFRYDVYCLAFPAIDMLEDQDPFFSAQSQFNLFLSHLEAWEVEEMSCVHFYFVSLVGTFVDDVENQLLDAALSAPGARTCARTALAGRDRAGGLPISDKARGCSNGTLDTTASEDGVMADFNALDLTTLAMFSTDARYRADEAVSFLASLGSPFIYQLLVADAKGRRDLVRKFDAPLRDFLPEAVDAADTVDVDTPHSTMPEALYEANPLQTGPGYYLFKRCKQDRYIRFYDGLQHHALRERAFVFWDSDRISQPEVARSLVEAAAMGMEEAEEHYSRVGRPSVQDRLEGLCIPLEQMDRIQREFGFPGDYE